MNHKQLFSQHNVENVKATCITSAFPPYFVIGYLIWNIIFKPHAAQNSYPIHHLVTAHSWFDANLDMNTIYILRRAILLGV